MAERDGDDWVSLAKDDGNFAGWLKKQGDKGLIKGWKNRWFVLNKGEGRLYYYKQEGAATPLNFVDLSWATSVFSTGRSELEFAIKMHDNSPAKGRVYILQALTKQDVEAWVLYLTQAKNDLESRGKSESNRINNVERRSSAAPPMTAAPSASPAQNGAPSQQPSFNAPTSAATLPSPSQTISKADIGDWGRTATLPAVATIASPPNVALTSPTSTAQVNQVTSPAGTGGPSPLEARPDNPATIARERFREHRRAMLMKKNAKEERQRQLFREGEEQAAIAAAAAAAIPENGPLSPNTPQQQSPPSQSAFLTSPLPPLVELPPVETQRPLAELHTFQTRSLTLPEENTSKFTPLTQPTVDPIVVASPEVKIEPLASPPHVEVPKPEETSQNSSSEVKKEETPAEEAPTKEIVPTAPAEIRPAPTAAAPSPKPPKTRVQDISEPNLVIPRTKAQLAKIAAATSNPPPQAEGASDVPTAPEPVIPVEPSSTPPISQQQQQQPVLSHQVVSVESFRSFLVDCLSNPDVNLKLTLGGRHEFVYTSQVWKLLSDTKSEDFPPATAFQTFTWKLKPNLIVRYLDENGLWYVVIDRSLFSPPKPTWKLEDIVDRLEERSILTQLQKGMLLNLYKEVHVLQRMYERGLAKLVMPSEEEKRDSLDEELNPDVSLMVRSAFCTALACVFADQFNPFSFFGSRSLWDFVYNSATNRSSVVDPSSISMIKAVEFIANDKRMDDDNMKFRAFICTALNYRCLYEWISELLRNKKECSRFYEDGALVFVAPILIADATAPLWELPFRLRYDKELS